MVKKVVFTIIVLLLLPYYFYRKEETITTPFIDTRSVINLSITFFDSKEFCDTGLLKTLFVEDVYKTYVKEELASFKSLTVILAKPFVNFWLIAEGLLHQSITKIDVYLTECKKTLFFVFKIFIKVFLPFILLFYFKARLKTHRLAPMVLRC